MMELETSSMAGIDSDKTSNRNKYTLDEPL